MFRNMIVACVKGFLYRVNEVVVWWDNVWAGPMVFIPSEFVCPQFAIVVVDFILRVCDLCSFLGLFVSWPARVVEILHPILTV